MDGWEQSCGEVLAGTCSHATVNLQHVNGRDRSVQYYILTQYRRKVTVSAVAFRPVNESSDSPFPLHQPLPFSISPLIPPSNVLFPPKKLVAH
ncbi:hypothetical protein EVAR_21006_1 [Eumeta japonica]|uniref:Uncharacterized protein n=1 Tax=Eumeta variegata TaxID=151549 RepID=A0A4C1V826_EUMVA|nr:hypothetical protein EVAR_21006_1 [Eumeta japonica]